MPEPLATLISDKGRVSVTTWGRHLGCNDHREIANVILVGSWNYDSGTYDAISLAASGAADGTVADNERRATKAGEFMHNVYQAVCRCRVRKSIGGECSPANAYLIMPDSADRRRQIEKAFPGCSIEAWNPVSSKKESKSDRVMAALIKMLESRMMATFQEVREACGSEQKSFLTKIVKDPRFRDALATNGIRIMGKGAGRKFYKSGTRGAA